MNDRYCYVAVLTVLLLCSLPVCLADFTWENCSTNGFGGELDIDANCNGSEINVDIIEYRSTARAYIRLFEYVCTLPNNTTRHGDIEQEYNSLSFPYTPSLEESLPGGTFCVIRGCYEINSKIKRFDGVVHSQQDANCTTDTNECADGSHECGEHGVCSNTHGSYDCSCEGGYEVDEIGRICHDIDECKTGANECHDNATCSNTEGSYECTCNTGYGGDGISCTDINECKTGANECDEGAECSNTDGGYECECRDGFTGNGTHCDDIDECQMANDTCHENAECINTDGGFECVCKVGFTGNETHCDDIDECETGANDCHVNATCSNTEGSYQCTCNTGYDGNGISCIDINECKTGANECDEGAECSNTDGGYECECRDGFTGNGTHCDDIDECQTANDTCHENAECINTDGGFECVCKVGFTGNETHCDDIDECETGANDCHVNATCNNTEGSYECTCNTGYDGNGISCTEIDKCEAANLTCHKDANCSNANGTLQCVCTEGYTGNGTHCDEKETEKYQKETEKETESHVIALGLLLPLIGLVVVGVISLCILQRIRRRNRRDYGRFQFDVESKVDLTYDPGVIRLDAAFTIHSSMGSILHELRYERDRPLMTASPDEGSENLNTHILEEEKENVSTLASEEPADEREKTHHHSSGEDNNFSTSSQTSKDIYLTGRNDSNSSYGNSESSVRRTTTTSDHTNSSSSTYVTEQGGAQSSSGDSVFVPWLPEEDMVTQTNLVVRDTGYCGSNAQMVDNVNSAVASVQIPANNTGNPSPGDTLQDVEGEVPAFDLHDEKIFVDFSKDTSATSASQGYVSSDHYPATRNSHTLHTGVNSMPAPSHSSHVSDFAHETATAEDSVNIESLLTHRPATLMPTTTGALRASSLASLNVITDLEQAFPLISRFASGESLYQPYYHTEATQQPPQHSFSSKARSQTNVHSFGSASAVHSEYPAQAQAHVITLPSAQTTQCLSFSNPNVVRFTTKSESQNGNLVDRLHLRSTHTFSGSSADTILGYSPETVNEYRVPDQVSTSHQTDTLHAEGKEHSTTVSFTKNGLIEDSAVKQSSSGQTYSDYVNLDSATPLLYTLDGNGSNSYEEENDHTAQASYRVTGQCKGMESEECEMLAVNPHSQEVSRVAMTHSLAPVSWDSPQPQPPNTNSYPYCDTFKNNDCNEPTYSLRSEAVQVRANTSDGYPQPTTYPPYTQPPSSLQENSAGLANFQTISFSLSSGVDDFEDDYS